MRRLIASILTSLALLFVAAPRPAEGAASRPSSSAPSLPNTQLTPAQEAEQLYNEALRLRDQAWKEDEKAEAATEDKDRQKHADKARKYFDRAADKLGRATELDPKLYQAFSSLGYALRRTGRYEDSVTAYDRSLAINPTYPEAIEYRGEAYLGLGRLEDAKAAYMQLFKLDRPKADQLLEAMGKWVARRGEATSVSAEEAEAFAAWVAEREKLAEQTADLGGVRQAW